jgi:hypothetical protein
MHFLHATSSVLRRVAEFQYLPLVPTISKIFRHVADFSEFASGSTVSNRASAARFFPVHRRYFGNITRPVYPLARFLV